MMLKSMRDASLGGSLMDNKQSEFYRDMYDKQIAVDAWRSGRVSAGRCAQAPARWRHIGQYSDLTENYLGMPITARPVNGAVRSRSVAASRRRYAWRSMGDAGRLCRRPVAGGRTGGCEDQSATGGAAGAGRALNRLGTP